MKKQLNNHHYATPHIKAIMWDCGNILVKPNHLKACRKLASYSSLSPENIYEQLFLKDDAPSKLHDSGELSSEEFFIAARMVACLGESLLFQEFCIIWKDIFEENEGIETVIDKVRPGLKNCILSNTDPIHWSAVEKLPVMKKYFLDPKMLVLSYTSGTRKPDKKIYQDALKCLGLTEKDAPHVLYIDDVAEYRDAFVRIGGNVLAYDCSKDTIANLEEGLRKFNVLK